MFIQSWHGFPKSTLQKSRRSPAPSFPQATLCRAVHIHSSVQRFNSPIFLTWLDFGSVPNPRYGGVHKIKTQMHTDLPSSSTSKGFERCSKLPQLETCEHSLLAPAASPDPGSSGCQTAKTWRLGQEVDSDSVTSMARHNGVFLKWGYPLNHPFL